MLQALRFLMNFDPAHAENLREHALDQVMAKNGLPGNLPSFGSQLDAAALLDADQSVSFSRFKAAVTAGGVTESQWARSAEITVLPSASASAMALR